MRRTTLLLAAMAVGAAACGDAGDPTVAPSPLPTSAPTDAGSEATPTERSSESPLTPPAGDGGHGSRGDGGDVDGSDGGDVATGVDERWIVAAKRDLAAHLGIDVTDVVVVEGGDVDWNDSSLGCPQPGQAYLQVITPGYRLVLAHDGTRHHYHGARDREPIRCERPAEGGYGSSSDT